MLGKWLLLLLLGDCVDNGIFGALFGVVVVCKTFGALGFHIVPKVCIEQGHTVFNP